MIGLLELYSKSKEAGVVPLPGCEFYVVPDKDHPFQADIYDYCHVTVWAYNEQGYKNLMKLGSISWQQDELFGISRKDKKKIWTPKDRVVSKFGVAKPRITFDELAQYSAGLVGASGCLIGPLAKATLNREREGFDLYVNKLRAIFKDRLYLEIMPHCVTHNWNKKTNSFEEIECTDLSPDGDLQRTANLAVLEAAKRERLPLLLTVDSHFVKPEQKGLQDAILSQGEEGGFRFHNSYHMVTTNEAWQFWRERYGEDEDNRKMFQEAVENNHAIADLAKDIKIQTSYHQVQPEIPQEITAAVSSPKEQQYTLVYNLINKHGRMPWGNQVYEQRLQSELEIIVENGKLNFLPYFLFKEKWGSWAREMGLFHGIGRGSAGGSLLSYLLKITHIDPIKWQLPFERFLSRARIERGKYPDIDSDWSDRDLLLEKLKEEYGDRYAQISTHGTLKIKMAIKDALRFFEGQVSKEDEKFIHKIPNTPMGVMDQNFLLGYVDKDKNVHEGLVDTMPELKAWLEARPAVFDMMRQLLGIPRSVGRHASGIVVSDVPVSEVVPTCYISGSLCTQYTANDVEKSGLIKYDELTVTFYAYVARCIWLIHKDAGWKTWSEQVTVNGQEFTVLRSERPLTILPIRQPDGSLLELDVYNLPEEKDVFDMISAGDTASLFQISSNLLTDFCRRTAPRSVADISALVALVRPGPLDAEVEPGLTMAEAYVKRRAGEIPVKYPHPDMEQLTSETYGIILYQEQLQKAFSILADYSPEDADYFREVLAKKKAQEVQGHFPKIREKLAARGWNDVQVQTFIDACTAASRYSFNCIDGDELLVTDEGLVPMRTVASAPEKFRVATLNESHAVSYVTPSHGAFMGEKEVFEIVLENGNKIQATEDHRFYTNHGWKTLKEVLSNNYEILIVDVEEVMEAPVVARADGTLVKVTSFKSLGVKRVYDLEIPGTHNFILQSGAVAHNCAHSAAYGSAAYIGAYLKKRFPVEWWAAVLSASDVSDIKKKGYSHAAKDHMRLPHVNGPIHTFEVVEQDGVKTIDAPLAAVLGFGQASRADLQKIREKGPISSILDFFCRTRGTRISSGVFKDLVLSGCFDLLHPDMEKKDMLELYFWLQRVSGLKAGRDKMGEELLEAALARMESHPEEIQDANLDPGISDLVWLNTEKIRRLSLYDFHPLVALKEVLSTKGFIYTHKDVRFRMRQEEILVMENLSGAADYHSAVGWVGILTEVKGWTYQSKKKGTQETACKLQVDCGGEVLECVMWPDTYQRYKPMLIKMSKTDIVFVVGSVKASAFSRSGYSMNVDFFRGVRTLSI